MLSTGRMQGLLLTQGVLEKLGLKQEGNFLTEMRDGAMGELTQDKETGQALHLNITFSPQPNPIPNEIRHSVGKRNLSRDCIQASDLSSTGIIIDTSGKCSKNAQGYRQYISLLVCHSYVLLLSCSTVASSEPNTRKQT